MQENELTRRDLPQEPSPAAAPPAEPAAAPAEPAEPPAPAEPAAEPKPALYRLYDRIHIPLRYLDIFIGVCVVALLAVVVLGYLKGHGML